MRIWSMLITPLRAGDTRNRARDTRCRTKHGVGPHTGRRVSTRGRTLDSVKSLLAKQVPPLPRSSLHPALRSHHNLMQKSYRCSKPVKSMSQEQLLHPPPVLSTTPPPQLQSQHQHLGEQRIPQRGSASQPVTHAVVDPKLKEQQNQEGRLRGTCVYVCENAYEHLSASALSLGHLYSADASSAAAALKSLASDQPPN
ncbi:hypothetical protein Dimus_039373 [Dionaea muscipula]